MQSKSHQGGFKFSKNQMNMVNLNKNIYRARKVQQDAMVFSAWEEIMMDT